MGTTSSCPPDPKREPKDKHQEAKYSENIPSVFVNYEYLNFDTPSHTRERNQKVYEIDGKNYADNLYVRDDFEEFKLYAERADVRDKETETPPKKQIFEVQIIDDGYLINNSIFLNIHHYNTIISIFEDCLNCFVCDDILMKENWGSHIESEDHKTNLDACPILEKYQLSISRIKNDHYHCGVCNEVFHKNTFTNHFAGQTHTNNEILASKKAAEINRNNDTRNDNNDTQNNDKEMKHEIDNIAFTNRISVTTEKNTFEISFNTWHMILITKDNTFYCMACELKDTIDNLRPHVNDIWHKRNLENYKIIDHNEKHLIRQNEKWCHCSTCNTLHYIGGTDLHIARHDKGKSFTESAKIIRISDDNSNVNANENNDSSVTNNPLIGIDANVVTNNKNENNYLPATNNPLIGINANFVNNNDETRYDIVKTIINEKCLVFLFGFKIQVSLLSLNVIFYNQIGFFHCELCKVKLISQTVIDHMKSLTHNSRLNATPAVQHYGYNYIRSINNIPHCGICHMLIQPSMLLLHLQDPYHIMQVNIALGLVNLPPPPAQVAKFNPNLQNYNQNLKKDAQNKINEVNVINPTKEIENRINGTKNIIDEIKNVINETKNTVNETKTIINENLKIKKSDVYIEVNESKIQEIESNYDDDCNTDIFDAEIEVLTKKARVQVPFTSFNTLVPIGDGDRYCFACGVSVDGDMLKNHISSKTHMEMVKDIKFLEEYDYNLIRQNASLYHCALCNSIERRAELSNHIECTIHEEQRKNNKKNVKKKERNTVEYQNQVFPTEKEVISSSKILKDIIIKWSFIIKPADSSAPVSPSTVQIPKNEATEEIVPIIEKTSRNNKTIIIDDLNLKLVLNWDAWHSIVRTKNKYMCIICNEKMNDSNVDVHINSGSHICKLAKPFSTKCFPALIRQVNGDLLHCATCNIILYDKCNIQTHINGSKHKRHFEDLLNNSTNNCNEDIIIV